MAAAHDIRCAIIGGTSSVPAVHDIRRAIMWWKLRFHGYATRQSSCHVVPYNSIVLLLGEIMQEKTLPQALQSKHSKNETKKR